MKPDFYLWEDGFDYAAYFSDHEEEIETVDAMLADEKSRKVYRNLLQYKVSRDRSLIEAVRDDVDRQYFDPEIITLGTDEVFLDLGAYIGDTVEAFAKRVGGRYQSIVALEPDKRNREKLLEVASKLHNITCLPYGIGEEEGTARFRSEATWTSAIDENGDIEIEIKTVDGLFADKRLTLLKADIEGLEKQMLRGARKTIEEQMPQMALSAYHCKEDMFAIINIINSYHEGYKFYLRHYTEMPIDTVLYAVR